MDCNNPFGQIYLNYFNFFAVLKILVADSPICEDSFQSDFRDDGI